MLQRVQTIYLFIASIVTIGLGYMSYELANSVYYFGLFGLGIVLIVNIFLFKNRKLQIMINRLVCIGLIALLGLSFYESGILSGEKQFSEKDIKLALPVISIVFLLIANKYIKRDEALVKSVDRIR
jgi:FtsH-binding integral membrane protein